MKYYINYSDESFKTHQNFALKMAKIRGGFNRLIGYNRKNIDKDFYEKYKQILEQKRGGGYWLWKPYFINKKLSELIEGDYLFYSDSGAFFLKSVDILIEELNKIKQDIMGFELPLIESQWTKKELFSRMDCSGEKFSESNQIMASFILIQKSRMSVEFIRKYLDYSCDEINITDKHDENINQSSDFIDHRHDQSIFSLLYKKYNLQPFKDPCQLGKYPKGYGAMNEDKLKANELHFLKNGRLFREKDYKEDYTLVMYHNRKGKPIISFFKYKIKELLFKINLYNGNIR